MAETIEGNARAFTLHNDGNFVAHIVLIWTHPETGKSGEYEQSGYHDICKYAERTVNLSDTDIPLGALVHLKVDVVLGKDKEDHKRSFTYTADGKTADYTISGWTLSNDLTYNGLK